MDEERRTFSPPLVGGSSLLVIFAVLCLIVFALLAISTVQADRRLGDAALASVEGYYEADAQAEETLARLRAGEVPEGVDVSRQGSNTLATYAVPFAETQELQVQVLFTGGLGDRYQIQQWQAHSTVEVNLDQNINVWNGGL